MRFVSLTFAVLAAACSPGSGRPVDQTNQQATADWMNWHDQKRATDSAVSAALNRPDGTADYAKAITITEASRRPQSVIDLEVGNIILGAYRDPEGSVMPRESLVEGIERLERAALGDGEGAEIAPERLARWYARGAGAALAPNATLAACWQHADVGKSSPNDCISLRKSAVKNGSR